MNPVDALEGAGFKPIIVDEDTDIELAVQRAHEEDRIERETNSEFVHRIMNYGCPTGALIQPFVIEALFAYAEIAETLELPEDGMLSGKAWRATASWLKSELEKKYGTH